MSSSGNPHERDPDDPPLDGQPHGGESASVGSCDRIQTCDGSRPGSRRYHVGDGFFFHQQRAVRGRIYLRCVDYYSDPRCTVRAVINCDHTHFSILNNHHGHTHDPDIYFLRVQQLRASLLEACRVRPNVRIDVIYHDVCQSVRRDVSSRVPLLTVRSSMIRAQHENRPNIPHTFQELSGILSNDPSLGNTLDMEMELYQGLVGREGHQSLIFMSRRVIEGVANLQHLFVDATFYCRPNMPDSAQLYTMVTTRDNHIIPLCYALMESRSAEAYRDMFERIRALAPNINPTFIMSDFEVAQQLMLTEVFPRARIAGCLWHYARALCRNLRRHGLHALIRDTDNGRRIARLCMSIPLAPPGRLQEALTAIVVEARRLQLGDEFAAYFQYIQETWINGVGDALCVFGVRHRTNNVAESHHRTLNSRLVRRPNLWRFLEMLREMEDLAWRDLGRIELGQSPSRARRSSSMLNDARIRSCSRQVMMREMDMLHFLSCVSHTLEGILHDAAVEVEDGRHASPPRESLPHCPSPERSVTAPRVMSHARQVRTRSPSGTLDEDFEAIRQQEEQVEEMNHERSLIDDGDMLGPSVRRRRNQSSRGRRRAGSRSVRGGRGGSRPRASLPASPPPLTRGSTAFPSRQITSHTSDCSLEHQALQEEAVMDLRPDVFSDPEPLDDDQEPHRSWQECLICRDNVGNYMILGCGAFPLCGSCIRRWFLTLGNERCIHCGAQIYGWVRVHIP